MSSEGKGEDFGGLAPDALGPTVTIGEILVEVMATDRGIGFLEPLSLIGPFASGAPAIFINQCARMGGLCRHHRSGR